MQNEAEEGAGCVSMTKGAVDSLQSTSVLVREAVQR